MKNSDVAYTTAQPSTEELHDAIAARLPDELKSFDAWYYNSGDGTEHGLHDYLSVLNTRIANPDIQSVDVMNAAGLSVADWFRHMLTRPIGS